MINLIFEKVPHKSGKIESLVLPIDIDMITWKILLEFLQEKTGIKNFKLFIKNNFRTISEIKYMPKQIFSEMNDFHIIKVKPNQRD